LRNSGVTSTTRRRRTIEWSDIHDQRQVVVVSENTDDAIGVYGVLSWIIAQRTREIGVRAALGAQTADVRRMVLRQGLAITGLGLAIGLAAAALLKQPLASLLFDTSVDDPAFATGRTLVSGQSG
jgi:hypothetical protein